jgi:3-dehydroquinate synthase
MVAASYTTVKVNLGPRSYPIIIGEGTFDQIGPRLLAMGLQGKAAVVTHETLGRLFAPHLTESLAAAGFTPLVIEVPEGEEAKSMKWADRLYRRFIKEGLERWSPVLALGGGVVGDLAGFVAGSYMRGTPFFQLPTTLVSQVDSSIGGKVALNHPAAKNVIGLFYQPGAVFIDPGVLKTLPERDIVAGMGEVIRYAAAFDARFFRYLETHMADLLALESGALRKTIRRCCAIKAGIVEADERELLEIRSLLNYGHTIGHAVETSTDYSVYRHGEAVAIGMASAARLAWKLGICSRNTMERQVKLIKDAGLPVILRDISSEKVLKSLKLDKKVKHGKVKFILTEAIGRAKVHEGINMADVLKAMAGRRF